MNIRNKSFENYPIEFKEVNPVDFNLIFRLDGSKQEKEGFEVGKKVIISPDKKTGFINEALQDNIQLDQKNTVVINAAVGQGKSYAIIQTIKRYYDEMKNGEQKYLIVVASPFVSLVKQYCNDIHKDAEIPENQIYNYDNLGRTPFVPYIGKPIQVVTANTLLGNPGEDGFKNSNVKRDYINNLIKHCKATNTKVVFVYDEIHDSYYNFKEEYVFNLWKWRDIIHKNFILSATYNEASKVVIEYLAELTDKKIKIIESKRIRFPQKQSSLYLHYSPAHKYNPKTPEIVNLIKSLIQRDKNIDILCYSKSLAKSLIRPTEEIGKLLKDTYEVVKECTSELIAGQRAENEAPKNQFDNTVCNVGTNFKTGVSIKKENHAFVIIMPPRSTRLWFRNQYGVFSGGINSVIQALARQRVKGEIHIILPKPDEFNFKSLRYTQMSDKQKAEFESLYKEITHSKKSKNLVSYHKLNRQDMLMLRSFYEQHLEGNLQSEIEHINTLQETGKRQNMPILKFPTFEQFKLNHGEDYLANNYPFFGEDISAYVSYGAITNQFINCKLKEINHKPKVLFTKGWISEGLKYYYQLYFGEDHFNYFKQYGNFSMYYHDVRNTLFNEFELRYKKDTNTATKDENLTPYSMKFKEFEIQLLQFTAKYYYGKSYEYWNPNQEEDVPYSRAEYFLDNIKQCISIQNNNISNRTISSRERFYILLNDFRVKLLANIECYETNTVNFCFLYNKPPSGFFSEEDILKFEELESLIEYDEFLVNGLFEFKRRLSNKSQKSKLNSFYSILCEDFIVSEESRMPTGARRYIKKVQSTKLLPYKDVIGLIAQQDYIHENSENSLQAHIERIHSDESYAEKQAKLLNSIKKSIEKE